MSTCVPGGALLARKLLSNMHVPAVRDASGPADTSQTQGSSRYRILDVAQPASAVGGDR